MYLPPLDSFLWAIGADRASYARNNTITLPKVFFNMLLELALKSSTFNESGYLKENPDVNAAIGKGQVENALQHYSRFGYLEGRRGGTPTVDEAWYLATYPDVAKAVRSGQIPSATEHYYVIGAGEGRSPNGTQVAVAARWKAMLEDAARQRSV
jgi:hypothetical protein